MEDDRDHTFSHLCKPFFLDSLPKILEIDGAAGRFGWLLQPPRQRPGRVLALYDGARAQAQAGAMSWSELYKQSFDRLTALPPSLQQDTRLENTVLLLSVARKLESNEISPQQFAMERDDIETQLQARLR